MTYHEIFNQFDKQTDSLQVSRDDLIAQIVPTKRYDVIVAGGGIHGAAIAHLAAFNGLKTLLLERSDYASETSSRSSKMAHGGLRYLELFDFKQVLEGVRARNDLYEVAPHLVHPHPFYVPVSNSEAWFRQKLRLGLWFYGALAGKPFNTARWIDRKDFPSSLEPVFRESFTGAFQFFDGLMNDSRLVMEHITAARQEGAHCLNYASVVSASQGASGEVSAGWRDELLGKNHEARCGVLINCTGPWAAHMGRLNPGPLVSQMQFSRGVHLLFSKPWKGPAVLLPIQERSRYYFVWPFAGSTMVGTTEREIPAPEHDPIPTRAEVDEVLARVTADLPGSGLDRSNLYHAFAGIRTLALRGGSKKTAQVSRKHRWIYSNGILTLVGGKFTTASWTAYEGLRQVFKLSRIKRIPTSLAGRKLPGAGLLDEAKQEFFEAARAAKLDESHVERVVGRLGSRVRFLMRTHDGLKPLSPYLLKGELDHIVATEQVEHVEDLMRRRLGLEYLPDHGTAVLNDVRTALAARPNYDIERGIKQYDDYLAKVSHALGK